MFNLRRYFSQEKIDISSPTIFITCSSIMDTEKVFTTPRLELSKIISITVEKLLTKNQSYDLWCKEFQIYEEGKSSGSKLSNNDHKREFSTS